jgi:hypothetical protein
LDRGGTWRNREDSYKEDHYPYAQRDVVDDTIHEEDFQTKTTTFPGTLYFTAISTTRLSVIQSLLLSIVMNGMVRGGVVHGLFKMIQT